MCLDCARAPLSVLRRHADIPLLANTPPYLPVQATQAWAQCVWCEKWRRVPVLLDSRDRFHCADCTVEEDPMALDEQVVPELAPRPFRHAEKNVFDFSGSCAPADRRGASCPSSAGEAGGQAEKGWTGERGGRGSSAGSAAAAAAFDKASAASPPDTWQRSTTAPCESLQATTSPGNPRRAQLGSTAALHGHVGQEERAQEGCGSRAGSWALSTAKVFGSVELPVETFVSMAHFLDPFHVCLLSATSKGHWVALCDDAIWKYMYGAKWGPTSAERAGRAGWESDDGEDEAEDDEGSEQRQQAEGVELAGAKQESEGLGGVQALWRQWFIRRSTSNNVVLL